MDGTPERQQRVWGGQLAMPSHEPPPRALHTLSDRAGGGAHACSSREAAVSCVGEPQPFPSPLKKAGVEKKKK